MLHAEHVVSEAAHMLAIRGECNETAPALASAVDGIGALRFSGSITASRVATDGTQIATAASADTNSGATSESVAVSYVAPFIVMTIEDDRFLPTNFWTGRLEPKPPCQPSTASKAPVDNEPSPALLLARQPLPFSQCQNTRMPTKTHAREQ